MRESGWVLPAPIRSELNDGSGKDSETTRSAPEIDPVRGRNVVSVLFWFFDARAIPFGRASGASRQATWRPSRKVHC